MASPTGPLDYISNPVFRTIEKRLRRRHFITLRDHIDKIYKIGVTTSQGIEFKAKDHVAFANKLRMPFFAPDNRSHWAGGLASLATIGQGYREAGVPSLHVAVAPHKCSVHLDTYGFVAIGPDGKAYYDPDAIQHIIDELLLHDKLFNFIAGKHPRIRKALGRLHLTLPRKDNAYRPEIGGRVVLIDKENWQLGLEVSRNLNGETKAGATLEVFSWGGDE